MNEKLAQCIALAREIHAGIQQPKGIKDFETQFYGHPDDRNFFGVRAYLEGAGYVFISGYGQTIEEAMAELTGKIPAPVTADKLRADAAALLEKASQLENSQTS